LRAATSASSGYSVSSLYYVDDEFRVNVAIFDPKVDQILLNILSKNKPLHPIVIKPTYIDKPTVNGVFELDCSHLSKNTFSIKLNGCPWATAVHSSDDRAVKVSLKVVPKGKKQVDEKWIYVQVIKPNVASHIAEAVATAVHIEGGQAKCYLMRGIFRE